MELARYNIRVNSIHPGLVDTPMSQGVAKDFMAPIPMRRGASPAEISALRSAVRNGLGPNHYSATQLAELLGINSTTDGDAPLRR